LKNSLAKRGLGKGMTLPKIRADNGTQFVSNQFEEAIEELGLIHERIPVKTPNMNAHKNLPFDFRRRMLQQK
jgi:putative transposase